LLLGSLSGQAVSDTASGMRVIRRDALAGLYPLPDGLHFTPAMSARAIMNDFRIVEVPMTYAERVGESKLRISRDGVRFLVSIGDAALLYHPGRLFRMGAAACVIIAVLWGLYPAEYYLRYQVLEEWMIYRLLLCGLLFTSAFGLICASVLSEQILSLVHQRRHAGFLPHLFERLLNRQWSQVVAGLAAVAAVVLVWPAVSQYAGDGRVTIHWSRPMAAVFLLQVALLSVIHTVMRKIVDLWKSDLAHASRRVDGPIAASTATTE
jgi:hypothetical protein